MPGLYSFNCLRHKRDSGKNCCYQANYCYSIYRIHPPSYEFRPVRVSQFLSFLKYFNPITLVRPRGSAVSLLREKGNGFSVKFLLRFFLVLLMKSLHHKNEEKAASLIIQYHTPDGPFLWKR